MKRLRLAFWSAFLLSLPSPAEAIEVGPEFVVPDSALAGEPVVPHYPRYGPAADGRISAALCGEHYLVTWGGVDGSVYAVRVGTSGDVLDSPPLRLTSDGNSPSVASNGDSCLIVWASPAWPTSIQGVRLSLSAEPLDAPPIVIASGNDSDFFPTVLVHPYVATDGVDYLVSYYVNEYTANTRATVLTRDGLLLPEVRLYASPMWDSDWALWSFAFNGSILLWGHSLAYMPDPAIDFSLGCFGAGTPAAPLCHFVQYGSLVTPIAAASDGSGFLVLFHTLSYPDHPDDVSGLRAAWLVGEPGPQWAETGSLVLDEPGAQAVVTAYDGREYLGIWFTPAEAPASRAVGALLPVVESSTVMKEGIFTAVATVPALASSGRGSSLLLYASPSATDPAVKEVRGRIVFTDATAPTVQVPGPMAAVAASRAGAVVTFTATAEDDYPGAVATTCLPASGSTFPPGLTTVSCLAVDAAGNAGTASFEVAVTFAWSGVLPPLSSSSAGSTAKRGRTLPVKFRLTGESAAIVDLAATLSLVAPAGANAGAQAARPSTAFRYDAAAGQYVLNLPTASLTPGAWTLRIDLGDGAPRTVSLTLR